MAEPKLSVIVPNYKMPELTKICLRLLRKYTEPGKIRVIVVDNDSRDDSVEYLRRLKWITLLERQVPPEEPGFVMCAKAFDEAFSQVDTPYVMVMHTDTFVLHPDWLDYIWGHFDSNMVAGVGCWKLEEPRSLFGRLGHFIIDFFRRLFCSKAEQEAPWLRSHFAVYRSDLLRQHTNGFYDGEPAGKSLHRKLVSAGFEMLFLPPAELSCFVCRVDHTACFRKSGKLFDRIRLNKKMQIFWDVLDSGDLDL